MCNENRDPQLFLAPVVSIQVSALWGEHEGWGLVVSHRHESGDWSDCGHQRYEHLTSAELLDVAAASIAALQDYSQELV